MQREDPLLLVIDDVAAIVEELVTLLALNDIQAVGVANLRDAIAALEANPAIRVIACDVRLDRENGLRIVSHVQQHPDLCKRGYRYIFITGDHMQVDLEPGFICDVFLTKPVQPKMLINVVRRLLDEGVH